MPTYEYKCEANNRVIEVSHKMAERLNTWKEVCDRAGISTGKTDPNAPVTKLMSAGFVNTGSSSSSYCETPCDSGPCESGPCGGGMCGLQ